MNEELLQKLTDIENQINTLNQNVDEINQKVNQTQREVLIVKEETKKAERTAESARRAASSAENGGCTTAFFGLILIVILAMISNPSAEAHKNFMIEKGHSYLEIAKGRYKSFYVYSKIDSNGDEEGGMVTFGIFGNVFEIKSPE